MHARVVAAARAQQHVRPSPGDAVYPAAKIRVLVQALRAQRGGAALEAWLVEHGVAQAEARERHP